MRLPTGTAGGSAAEDLVPRAVRVSTAVEAPATTATSTDLVVHVAGAVGAPGIQRLLAGSRVADAVAAAGGALPGADLGRVNLAAPLADGSQVYVPAVGETVPSVAAPPSGSGRPGGAAGDAEAPVDLNAASEAELEDLPGIGPATAAAIVRYRAEHRFATVDDLLAVPGIGPAKLEGLRERVRV
jgi:competence protein ComEA